MHSVCFFNGVVQCFELVKLSTYKHPVVAVIIIIFIVVDRDCGERLGATVEGGLEAQHGPGHQHHLHLLLLLLLLTVPRGHSTLQGTVLIQTYKQLKRKAWNISHFIHRMTFRIDWISTAETYWVNRFLAFMLLMQSAKQFLSTHHMRFRFVWILLTEMYRVSKFLAFVLLLLVQRAKHFLSIYRMRFRFVWILLTEMYRVNKLLAFMLLVQSAKHFLSIHRMRFTIVWLSSTEMH